MLKINIVNRPLQFYAVFKSPVAVIVFSPSLSPSIGSQKLADTILVRRTRRATDATVSFTVVVVWRKKVAKWGQLVFSGNYRPISSSQRFPFVVFEVASV